MAGLTELDEPFPKEEQDQVLVALPLPAAADGEDADVSLTLLRRQRLSFSALFCCPRTDFGPAEPAISSPSPHPHMITQ